MKYRRGFISIIFVLLTIFPVWGQTEKIEMFAYGDMDQWIVRVVDESFIIGGNRKYFYEITSGDTLWNKPYKNTDSPWASSSVMAKVSGVVKTSITVFPEKRGEGYCARLETRMEHCKVLGLFNIRVIASGTIFLGEMLEPITDTKNPQSKLVSGIPFTGRPKALQYDYKLVTGGPCFYASGFGKPEARPGTDQAETSVLLQCRWEDAEGNVYAKRVATAWERFEQSVEEWQNGHRLVFQYGDITAASFYKDYMNLIDGKDAYYTRNSKGKIVPIHEIGWADAGEAPTHIVLRMSSSCGGAYIGNTDSRFWVDNVGLVY